MYVGQNARNVAECSAFSLMRTMLYRSNKYIPYNQEMTMPLHFLLAIVDCAMNNVNNVIYLASSYTAKLQIKINFKRICVAFAQLYVFHQVMGVHTRFD